MNKSNFAIVLKCPIESARKYQKIVFNNLKKQFSTEILFTAIWSQLKKSFNLY
jgi:hypothetical protein